MEVHSTQTVGDRSGLSNPSRGKRTLFNAMLGVLLFAMSNQVQQMSHGVLHS